MVNIRCRVERGFEHFASVLYRHRLVTLIVMTALIALLLSQIPKITIDTSTEGFLHETDLALMTYNEFRDQFGRDEVIIVAIKKLSGDMVFNPMPSEALEAGDVIVVIGKKEDLKRMNTVM